MKIGEDLFDLRDPNGQYLSKLLCPSDNEDKPNVSGEFFI